jgi:hypothetical protein
VGGGGLTILGVQFATNSGAALVLAKTAHRRESGWLICDLPWLRVGILRTAVLKTQPCLPGRMDTRVENRKVLCVEIELRLASTQVSVQLQYYLVCAA